MSEIPRIILHNDKTAEFARRLIDRFPSAGFRECNSYEELPSLLESYRPEVVYSVRFNGTPSFPREALFGAAGPKWIANGGAGTDHYGNWDTASVTVTNTAGVAADMMAEYVMGGFLHFTLDVPGLQADKAAQAWTARSMIPLKGKTLLIIGLGNTGQAIAGRAKAFGMYVMGTRARPQAMENVDEVAAADNLAELLPRADFIAVCTPLTKKTKGLLGRDEFTAAKPGTILADVSRGGVVDQSALLNALKSGKIGGAVLDVFETEPLPQNNTLWTQERILISPHCSSVFGGWETASFDLFLNNLERWIRNEPLQNIVDPQRGY